MAPKKTFQYKKRLSAIFASFCILIMGTTSLLQSMSIDYYSVMNTLNKVVPASILLGGIGWIMGAIIDKPRRRPASGYTNLFVNELMKKEINEQGDEETEDESNAVDAI